MTWVVWRQYRAQAAIAAVLFGALAVLLLITEPQMASQLHAALANGQRLGGLFLGSHEVGFLVIMTLGVPVLPGLFWGAPLVAHELETGTNQFAWMQSVTRGRWLAGKAGWMLLAAAVLSGAVAALVTWWSGPDNALLLDAFSPGRFDIMDIVPVSYALFAMALGIAAGALLRRTLPAMAVTLAGFIAVRSVIAELIRPHYLATVTVLSSAFSNYTPPAGSWVFNQGVMGPTGQALSQDGSGFTFDGVPQSALPAACGTVAVRGNPGPVNSCLQAAGYHQYVTFQPGSRYWAFQGIEAGIFVVLAAALIAVTFVVISRRDA
jgi:ABC-type transport system involved in multi-copper enzyme maturation permease subunit